MAAYTDVNMYAVLEKRKDITASHSEDDRLAELIKNLSRQEAEGLWLTFMQLNPRLADL
jgi:hypothetical protein